MNLAKELFRITQDSYNKCTHRVKEVECYVHQTEEYQVVAFRGTEASLFFSGGGWRDIIRDLRVIPWHDKRVGWAHSGFLKGARGVVDTYLVKELDKNKPTYLTGHSLGGALAVVAAKLMHEEGFNVCGTRTFGAPRSLLKSSLESYKAADLDTVEYSNLGDPIPDIPFRFFKFRHINEVFTPRRRNGYSVMRNHMIPHYKESFDV